MSKIRADLTRSDKITLLKALRKGAISLEEFRAAAFEDNQSAVFIKRKEGIYHLHGTDTFIMSEKEFNEHLEQEDYTTILILPSKDAEDEHQEKLFNGKDIIDWPSKTD
jgi:hypothetical protein